MAIVMSALSLTDFLSDGNSNVCILERFLVKIATWKFDLEDLGQGQQNTISQCRYSMENVKIYKRHFFTFLIIHNVWPERTKVTHVNRQNQTHPHTDTNKPIAVGEILQSCLKSELNRDDMKNYKPVWNLTFLTKILAIIVHSQLINL